MKKNNFNLLIIHVGLIISYGLVVGGSSKCDRTPEGSSASKSPPDGRYRLRIHNEPLRYMPGETYSLSLEGITKFGQVSPHKFTGFFLTVEKDHPDSRPSTLRADDDNPGSFQIAATATSKVSEKCRNLITHTSSFPKNEVLITWTAPPAGHGCVVFKSTVIEHRDVWYSDDGALSKVLCEDEADSEDKQPSVLSECTACDEAKYELTFEGLWSRQTHPKDFPDNGWLTKFSDVIGASHTTEFRFWTYGHPASDGLKDLAEHGSTSELEKELKDEGEHIRTIIKARGISYPNVTGKTFAVFRADATHHLMSLVSMIYPSPDWFVGVSGLELCLPNGSWVMEKSLNLYPYDAGTDSGPTYISSDQPTIPKEAIRRIKPNQPNDPRSPFHDPENTDMKPIARLLVARQRLYEKKCENQEPTQNQDEPGNECATTKWLYTSDCDSSCGRGRRTKQRNYKNPSLAYENGCKKKLIEHEECQGTEENCNGVEDEDDSENLHGVADDPECALTEYTEFTECSKACGKGQQTRTREYVHKKNQKRCQKRNQEKLEDTQDCEGQSCSGDIGEEKQPTKKTPNSCPTTKFSPFSKCNAKCGLGDKIRVRIPLTNQKRDENLQRITKLYHKLTSKSNRYNNDDDDDEESELDELDAMEISDSDHPCYETELIERSTCGMKNKPCEDDIYGMPPFCMIKPQRKNCKQPPENRWYFKKDSRECGIFTYTGCQGQNNFESEELCEQTCARRITNSLQSFSLVSHGGVSGKVDCKVSHWKHEPCNATTCGEGFRWKYRSIIQHPQNGGRACPRTLAQFERCFRECGSPKVIAPGNTINPHHHHRCQYSSWSQWTPCSKTCGDYGVQIRTRTVLNHLNTHLCNERLEERRCEMLPCLVGGGYSYNYNYRS